MKILIIVCLMLFVSTTSVGQYTATDTLSYTSQYFKDKRKLKISLPDEYASNPNRKYRVVYLFDAQSSALYNFTKASLSFFPGYASFYFDPVILVGIQTSNRHFEFLPKHVNSVPGPKNYSSAGGADTLALSIEKELKPLIEKRYRTNGYSMAIGHSLGGTFVTYAMLKHPKIFDAGVCISPNYTFDNEAIFDIFSKSVKTGERSGRFLYVAYGKADEVEEGLERVQKNLVNCSKQVKFLSWFIKWSRLTIPVTLQRPWKAYLRGLCSLTTL